MRSSHQAMLHEQQLGIILQFNNKYLHRTQYVKEMFSQGPRSNVAIGVVMVVVGGGWADWLISDSILGG